MRKLKRWFKTLFQREPDIEIKHLKRYLKRGCVKSLEAREDLMDSDEALKHFGEMWGKYKADTMMMLTSLEQEFLSDYEFTEGELRVARHFIGKIGLFFKECKEEHDSKIEAQNLRAQKEEKEKREKEEKEKQ